MKKIASIFISMLIMSMLIITTSCGSSKQAEEKKPDQPSQEKAEIVKFAAIYPTSGAAAPWGLNGLRAMELGAEAVNSRGGFTVKGKKYNWKVISYDSKLTPADTVAGVEWAVNTEGVKLLSTMGGGPTAAAGPVSEKYGALNVAISVASDKNNPKDMPLTFWGSTPVSNVDMWSAIIGWFAKEKGVKTMALFNSDDLSGEQAMNAMHAAADKVGVKIVVSEKTPQSTTDFYPLLTKALKANPDMIMTGILASQTASLLLKQSREMGYKGEVFLSWTPVEKQIISTAGSLAEGAYAAFLPRWETESQLDLRKRYSEKWDIAEADVLVIYYGKLMVALTEAIVEADSFEPKDIAAKFQEKRWDVYDVRDVGWGGEETYGIKRILDPTVYSISQIKDGRAVTVMNIRKQ